MRIAYLILLTLSLQSSSLYSQPKQDGEIAQFINSSEWFKVRDYFIQNQDSLSEFMKLCSKSLIDNFFNNPKGAIESLEVFTNKFGPQLGAENIKFITILAENYANSGDYDKTVLIYSSLINQLDSKLPAEQISGWRSQVKRYNVYKSTPPYQMIIKENKKDIIIPIDTGFIGIYLNYTHNGDTYRTIFDTGSATNAVSEEVAKRLGIKVLADSIVLSDGVNNLYGKMGVLDSIYLSKILFKNTPFMILPDASLHKNILDFDIILGLETMKLMEEVHFDFNRKQMKIPFKKNDSDADKNMIYISNAPFLNLSLNDKDIILFYDSGYKGNLLIDESFAKNIPTEKKPIIEKKRFRRAGGAYEAEYIRINDLQIGIGDNKFSLPKSYIGATMEKGGKGIIGSSFLEGANSLKINFKQMWVKRK